MKKILFISWLLFLFSSSANAQKEGNIWYFGLGAGVDFSQQAPTILTGGQIYTREGVAAISDRYTGKLLFYTEGTKVWNNNHQLMPNGDGLDGDYSSTQSSIIVPFPGNPKQYFLFTTAIGKGLRYSIINMSLDGGEGDVIKSTKNTLLLDNSQSTEKLIASVQCNGKDYWVISHSLGDNGYYVYPVTSSGIGNPQVYYVGSAIYNSGGDATGYLKLSPDANILANAIGNPANSSTSKVELFHFNNQTGTVSATYASLAGLNYPYGLEFSPNGNFLYVSTQDGQNIRQYNLTATDINAAGIVIFKSSHLYYGAMQLAPDGKIYVSAEDGYNNGYGYLGVINNPDISGKACNYVDGAFSLQGEKALIGLPTFVSSFFYDPSDFKVTDTCFGSNTIFHISNVQNIKNVKWDFGDGSSASHEIEAKHRYDKAGKYNVNLTINFKCYSTSSQREITILPAISKTVIQSLICEDSIYILPDGTSTSKSGTYEFSLISSTGCDSVIVVNLKVIPRPNVNLGNDTILCKNSTIILNAQNPGADYEWQDHSHAQTFTASKSGFYYVNVTNASQCSVSDSIKIDVSTLPKISLGQDTSICQGDTLVLSPEINKVSYHWQDGSDKSFFNVTQSGNYTVKVIDNYQCSSSDSINVNTNPVDHPNLGNDTILCEGTEIFLTPLAKNNNITYHWQDGSSESQYVISKAGTYSVKTTNQYDCSSFDTLLVNEKYSPYIQFQADSFGICAGGEVSLSPIIQNADNYQWNNGSQSPVYIAKDTGYYFIVAHNSCGDISDSVHVYRAICYLWMPNSFSPNNDGQNDYFRPKLSGPVDDFHFQIFDRWGNLLFESNDPFTGWNGIFQGHKCDIGGYVWVLRFKDHVSHQQIMKKGILTLIR